MNLANASGMDPEALVTRPVGEQFFPILESALRDAAAPVVILDFSEVSLIDGSFADEVLGTLAVRRSTRKAWWGCLAVRQLTPSSIDNLRMALLARTIGDKGLRNCVVPVIDEAGDVDLVGKAEGHVHQTFDLLRSRRELTARDVADALSLDIAAASTRLKTLFDLGLATRAEVRDTLGKQFSYTWPW
jgi:DNA-binding transcriptional ArsR family regulator